MKATLVGLERVEYTKKDGTEVNAHILHLSRDDANTVGQCCEQVYLTEQQLKNLKTPIYEDSYDALIGSDVNVDYNQRGRVCGLEINA